jgi:hypothetical protein
MGTRVTAAAVAWRGGVLVSWDVLLDGESRPRAVGGWRCGNFTVSPHPTQRVQVQVTAAGAVSVVREALAS